MTSNGTSPKRWRPRFSLRMLFVCVTLACAYFGAWEATKTYGVPAVEKIVKIDNLLYGFVENIRSPLPFCVHVSQSIVVINEEPMGPVLYDYQRDYLWLFGWIVHLRDVKVEDAVK